jgi:hypothetical protein
MPAVNIMSAAFGGNMQNARVFAAEFPEFSVRWSF